MKPSFHPPDKKTYYEVLGIPTNASLKEIQSAYLQLLETLKNSSVTYGFFPTDQLDRERTQIEEAYTVLSQKETRESYDQYLKSLGHPGPFPSSSPYPPTPQSSPSQTQPSPAPFPPPEEELWDGSFLKKLRERLGYTLKEVGEVTKVSTRYLESIEQHLFHKLPEKVFVRGFLTGYARFLKIDPEKVIHDFFQRWEEGKKR